MFILTGFVFASLVEYATVNFIYNKEKRSKKKRRNSGAGSVNSAPIKRTLSSSSFKSMKSSDSVYSTVNSDYFLKVSPKSIEYFHSF